MLVLVGPTASGKTSISLALARELNGEIVSADSRQVYRYMDIGTAKPTYDELESVKHHFINILNPDEDYNAGEYGKQARVVLDGIFDKGKIPIVVGGSGLYIQALTDGFFEGPAGDPELRERLYSRLHQEGAERLLAELNSVDPESASKMLPTNTKRLIRALEVYHITGKPISTLQKENIPPNFQPVFFGLQWERRKLYERIGNRVDLMIKQGLIDEVKKLQEMGYTSQMNSLQTVGYKETLNYLEGKSSIDEMVELIKRNSRRYAKRQLTWFRPDERIFWLSVQGEHSFLGVIKHIKEYFRSISF
ncbi:MAG: tRNA (adenosine(37)-N6)-dimethylallyltransferase MiaA [Bacteroidetes bacterium]|nr:MAG: tRNA (adenosine(37)-N6)-dimethylallyltransferase MiaA [Bacteroidota bacterium]